MTAASSAPVEGKVWASTVGAGAGTVTAGFLTWLLGVSLWGAPSDAAHAVQAVQAVPAPVSLMLGLALSVGATFMAGYQAKHTDRPAVPAPAPASDQLVEGQAMAEPLPPDLPAEAAATPA